MTDCVVDIELTVPSNGGDVPASGYLTFAPSKRRDLEGSIVLPDAFTVRLDDEGKASVTLTPTAEGDWAWKITERIHRGRQWYAAVPDGPGPVDYDDLVEVDKDSLDPTVEPVAAWTTALTNEIARATAAEAALADDVAELEALAGGPLRTTDGSFGLPAATGVGYEWVVVDDQMDGPYMDGVPL